MHWSLHLGRELVIMSQLKFDGTKHEISLVAGTGRVIGTWPAYNNVDSHAKVKGHLKNGTYNITDRIAPHPHAANANGPYGSYGIVRFNFRSHPGIGVHSGRANAKHMPGAPHPTMGCIRTTDEAMSIIKGSMAQDPLTTIEISNNTAVKAHQATQRNKSKSYLFK
jgi:hypothetical protein